MNFEKKLNAAPSQRELLVESTGLSSDYLNEVSRIVSSLQYPNSYGTAQDFIKNEGWQPVRYEEYFKDYDPAIIVNEKNKAAVDEVNALVDTMKTRLDSDPSSITNEELKNYCNKLSMLIQNRFLIKEDPVKELPDVNPETGMSREFLIDYEAHIPFLKEGFEKGIQHLKDSNWTPQTYTEYFSKDIYKNVVTSKNILSVTKVNEAVMSLRAELEETPIPEEDIWHYLNVIFQTVDKRPLEIYKKQ